MSKDGWISMGIIEDAAIGLLNSNFDQDLSSSKYNTFFRTDGLIKNNYGGYDESGE